MYQKLHIRVQFGKFWCMYHPSYHHYNQAGEHTCHSRVSSCHLLVTSSPSFHQSHPPPKQLTDLLSVTTDYFTCFLHNYLEFCLCCCVSTHEQSIFPFIRLSLIFIKNILYFSIHGSLGFVSELSLNISFWGNYCNRPKF